MKRSVRLYNLLVPIWLIWIFPPFLFVVLPANFLVDSIVLLVALQILKVEGKRCVYKKAILKVWGFGFLADLIAVVPLLVFHESHWGDWWEKYIRMPVLANPFDNPYSFVAVLCAVALAGWLIYVFNSRFSFRGLQITAGEKKRLALSIAVCTAPYLYFMPSYLFW